MAETSPLQTNGVDPVKCKRGSGYCDEWWDVLSNHGSAANHDMLANMDKLMHGGKAT